MPKSPECQVSLEGLTHCPVSGLPVLRRPEWTRVPFGSEYELTLSVIGENILLSQPAGIVTNQNVREIMALEERVVNESPLHGRPYVQIEDFSRFKRATLPARKYYIEFMKARKNLVGLLFFGSSPSFNLSIKLARHITTVPYEVLLVQDYPRAMASALRILGAFPAVGRAPDKDTLAFPQGSPAPAARESVSDPAWALDMGHASLRFEVFPPDTLLCIAAGYFERDDILACMRLHEQAIRSSPLAEKRAYVYVLNLKDTRGIAWRARKVYVDAIRDLNARYPLREVVFFGANRRLRAAISIARPLVPFPVRLVDTLPEALGRVRDGRGDPPLSGPRVMAGGSPAGEGASLQGYVEEILQFLGGIDWESGKGSEIRRVETSHPMALVYDALEIIKSDIDEISRERHRIEEELRDRNRSLRLLSEAGRRIHALRDLDPILDAVIESMEALTRPTGCSIWLMDKTTGDLVCRKATGPYREAVLGWRLKPGEGLVGWSAQHRESLSVSDAGKDPRHFTEITRGTGCTLRAILCVPLLFDKDLIGVLEVVDLREGVFDETVRDWLQSLAASASIAIENARLLGVAEKEIADRRQAEDSIREMDQKYRTILNNAPVGIMVIQNNKFCFFNRKVAQLIGYSPKELLEMADTAFITWVHPEDRPLVVDRYLRRLRGEPLPSVYPIRILKKGGDPTWVDIASSVITWEGNPATLSFMTDISERRQAEESLKESETRFKEIATLLPTTIVEFDGEGKVLYTNQAGFDTFGYSPRDIEEGMDIACFFPPEVRPRVPSNIRKMMEGGEAVGGAEYRLLARDGTEIACYVQSRPFVRDGRVCGIRATLTDIREMLRSQKALEASEEKYRNILESIQEGYYEVDLRGNFVFFNTAMTRLLGYSAAEMLGMNNRQYMERQTAEKIYALFHEVYTSGRPAMAVDLSVKRRDGTPFFVETSLSLIRDARGEAIGFRGIARDTTEKKRTEALEIARRKAEASNQAKGEFLAKMSHEIRTPLNAIIGMAELALDTELDDKQKRLVQSINSASNSLLNLINRILDFSKIEAHRLELEEIPFDLRYLLEDMTNAMAVEADTRGLDLILFVPPGIPTRVLGDPGRLRQALWNLLGNAVKFTHRGEIVLKVAVEADLGEKIRYLFTVKDTGIGIPKEKQEIIFEAFTQADGSTTRLYGGTGLGTSISKKLVELMGGRIGVESREGEGSTFWFTAELTLQREPAEPLPDPGLDLEGRKVLILDDNATQRSVLSSYLASWGCVPCEAARMEDLCAVGRSLLADGEQVALILADITDPPARGVDLASEIKAMDTFKETPVVVLSGISRVGDGKRCRSLGVDGYLTKPIHPQDLRRVVSTVLGLTRDEKERLRIPLVTKHVFQERDLSKVHVLLVEDYAMNQYIALENLRNAGYRVDIAENGVAAVMAFQRSCYDLILMDVQMPVMDGYEATRRIRELEHRLAGTVGGSGGTRRERTPIVAMTAHAFEGYREKCIEAGMDDYLSKPIRRETLLAMVEKWVTPAGPGEAPGGSPSPEAPLEDHGAPSEEAIPEEAAGGAPGEEGEPPLDLDLVLEEFMGKKELLARVLVEFRKKVPAQIEVMREALGRGDRDCIALEAHAIKGGAGNLTADALSGVAKDVECAAREGRMEGVPADLGRLAAEFQRLEAYLLRTGTLGD